MRVTVEYFGQLREAAGMPAEILEIQSPLTLGQLLELVAQRHRWPSDASSSGRALVTSRLVFVNQEAAVGDAARQLRDGDVVTLLSPIAGG